MNEFRYDTYCGLYCGACDILAAYKKSQEQHTLPQWNALPETIQQHIPQADIICYGCKSDTVFAGCRKCPIRKCARKKKGIESCLDCQKYPCLIHHISKLVKTIMRLEKKLPHLKITPKNLATIQQKGIRVWLEEQQHTWQCPDCQTHFTWYQQECSQCGKNLETFKDYNQ